MQPFDERFIVSLPGLGQGAPAPKSTTTLREYLKDPDWICVPAGKRHFAVSEEYRVQPKDLEL